MSETNDAARTARPAGKTLSLKKTETSTVKQSFSHGRSKAVVVEKKRARVAPQSPAGRTAPAPENAVMPGVQTRAPEPAAPLRDPHRAGVVLRQLTEEEKEARSRAISDARVEEVEARKRAEEDAKHRVVEEARLTKERAAAAKRKAEEDARKAADEQARRHAEEEANRRIEKKDETGAALPETLRRGRPVQEEEEEVSKKGAKAPVKTPARKGADVRRRGKLTVTAALSDKDERMRSVASFRRHLQRVKGTPQPAAPAGPREVTIPKSITVAELANRMARRSVDVIKVLMKNGMMATVNDVVDADTAELVATEYGHTVKRVAESDVLEGLKGADDEAGNLQSRPPIVTVMGHVDHGKTSLLDALRMTDVVAGEHGGITQHIGAYQVKLEGGQSVTFLDTPGHAAFSAMRARGANVTDIVILVVAADDGVMPQTIEAINHAKAAGAPIIVAINKIDRPDADPTRVINELLQHEIVVEGLGGDTQAIQVSATQKMGLDDLIEAILLQAEVLDLKANPDRTADGMVIEAKLDRGRGAVSTVLVKRGTLKRGDIVVAGANFGRVRALLNERGEQLDSAGPSIPVEILGLDGTPAPGEPFAVVENEARARE